MKPLIVAGSLAAVAFGVPAQVVPEWALWAIMPLGLAAAVSLLTQRAKPLPRIRF